MAAEEIEWLSQSECARRLTDAGDAVSQQNVSRYLARYPEIARQDFGPRTPMLVDFDALKRHREQNIGVQERRAEQDRENSDDLPPLGSTPATKTDDAAELRMRERRASAEKAEFELARARGELLPRAVVLKAIRSAGIAMQQVMKTGRLARAEALEQCTNARERAAIIEQQDEALLAEFSRKVLALGADEPSDDDEIAAAAAAEPAIAQAPAQVM